MVKEKSAARKYLEECKPLRDGQPAARPYVDIFTRDTDKPDYHGKDMTVNHVNLAFKCEAFATSRPQERADFALLLSEETIRRQNKDVQKAYALLKAARAARLREENTKPGEDGVMDLTKADSAGTALSRSLWLHGLNAAGDGHQRQAWVLRRTRRSWARPIRRLPRCTPTW